MKLQPGLGSLFFSGDKNHVVFDNYEGWSIEVFPKMIIGFIIDRKAEWNLCERYSNFFYLAFIDLNHNTVPFRAKCDGFWVFDWRFAFPLSFQ